MKKIGIVADMAADFPPEIREKYNIGNVEVQFTWPEVENLPGENIFQKMRELEKKGIKSFGKTSQPAPKSFLDQYKKQLLEFEKVICVTITSKHSGTFNSAVQAKSFLTPEEQKRIFIIDSLSASGGEALTVLKVIHLISQEKDAEEIVKEAEKFTPNISLFFMLEDPKWLEASGRISHLVANLMKKLVGMGIKPLLTFKGGKLRPVGLKSNAKDTPSALFKQFEKASEESRKSGRKIKVIINHGDNLSGAQQLKGMIEKEFKNIEINFLSIVNDVVGSITGPNTLIISWAEF